MYNHLSSDFHKIEYRKKYFLPKAIKEFRMAKKFPVWKWYKYTAPSTNNSYVIFYYAENANCIESPKEDFFAHLHFDRQQFVVKLGISAYHYTPNTPLKPIRILHVYTSHFLHRYNERFLKDESLSVNDIACQYLSRNDIAIPIEINEKINAHIRDYGEGGKQGFRVRDGFCFTRSGIESEFYDDENKDKDRVNTMVIVYTTFIPEKKMTDSQRFAIEREHLEKWKDFYYFFVKEAKNGTIKLKLES